MDPLHAIMPVKIWGVSEGPHPEWPCDRTFEEVDEKHEWNNIESLQPGRLSNTGNLLNCVQNGEIMVDLGCGDGTFAAEFKKRKPQVSVIAAGSHDLKPENIDKIDRVFYGYLPQQRQLLEEYAGQCEGVFETYGPTTYHRNPIDVANYAIYLLKSGGTYSCISSTVRNDVPYSVFGSRAHFDTVVKKFYEDKFGSRIALIDTKIKSRVRPGVVLDDCLLRMRVKGHGYVGLPDYDTLCQEAHDEIGEPKIIERKWFVADKEYKIEEKWWPKDPEAPALVREDVGA